MLGRANWRDRTRSFGIKQSDRLSHVYIVGQTGTGKSTLPESLIAHDLAEDRGLAFLDPHDDTVERVRARVGTLEGDQFVYLDAPSAASGVGCNPLQSVPPGQRALAASGIVEAFKWCEVSGGGRGWSTCFGTRSSRSSISRERRWPIFHVSSRMGDIAKQLSQM